MPVCLLPRPHAVATGLAVAATMLLASAPARADISNLIVYISQSSTQDSSGLSAPLLSSQVSVVTGKNEFNDGSVTAPDGTVYNVINQSSDSYPFDQFGAYFAGQPFGSFNVTMTGPKGPASTSLQYLADHYPDVAPQVANYAALQHFNPTLDNSILLTSGFNVPAGASAASTTFFIFDENSNSRLLQYSATPGTTVFDVPANTATPGEKIGFYFESDVNFDGSTDGVPNVTVYRKITTGEINAAPVPEPASWALMLAGVLGLGVRLRANRGRTR